MAHLQTTGQDAARHPRSPAEEKRRADRLMFEALAETVPAAITIYQDATHQYINRFGVSLTGYSLEELRHMTSLKLVHPDFREMVTRRSLARQRGQDVPDRYEFKYITKAGEERWVDFSGTQIEYEGAAAVLGVTIDITERKQAEEALRESERRFRTIFEQAAVGVAVVDSTSGEYQQINRCFCELVGYRLDEMIGNTFQNITHPDDLQSSLDNMASLRAGETREFSFEKRYLRKDGSIVWVNLTASRMGQSGDEPTTHTTIVEDITARKRSEQALKQAHDELERRVEERTAELAEINRQLTEEIEVRKKNEQELRLSGEIMKNMAEGVNLVRAADGILVYTNPRFDEIFGYEEGELNGKHVSILNARDHRNPRETAQLIIEEVNKKGVWSGDLQNVRKDGTVFWGRATVSTFEHPVFGLVFVSIQEDVTDRKEAEVALRNSEKLSSNAQRIAKFGHWDWNIAGGNLYWSDEIYRIFGRNPQEFGATNEAFLDTIHPDDRDRVQNAVDDALARNMPYSIDHRIVLPDGQTRFVHEEAEVTRDDQGSPIGMVGTVQDITERKQAERASLEKQAQLDGLLSNVGAIIMEGNGFDFYFVGGQVEKILGYPKEMWFEHPQGPIGFWSDLLHPDDSHTLEFCRQAVERGEDHSFEYRLIARDGKPVWFYDYVTMETRDGRPPRTRSILIDITDRKRAEEELQQSHEKLAHVMRLSTMGEMATGLAHEINQPLAAISSYCYAGEQALACDGPADPEILRELFKKSTVQTLRAGEIIRRLRALVAKRIPVRLQVDINQPIQEVLNILASDLRLNEIGVDLQSDHSNRMVTIDEIQIQQVLVNLIRNAIDAMSETDCRERTLTITTLPAAGGLVEVAVCDTGKGVLGKEHNQVFDAFFSTKIDGMGMGLAISRTIIQSHGGQLWVTSNSDRGVTFHFTLSTVNAWQ